MPTIYSIFVQSRSFLCLIRARLRCFCPRSDQWLTSRSKHRPDTDKERRQTLSVAIPFRVTKGNKGAAAWNSSIECRSTKPARINACGTDPRLIYSGSSAHWKHRSGLIARNHIVVSCWSGCTGQHKLGHKLFPMRQSFAETISRFACSRHSTALRASNFNLFKCSRAFSSDFSANSMSISAWQWPCALTTQPPPT